MNESSNPAMEKLVPVVSLMLYAVFASYCNSRNISPEDIQKACEALGHLKEEHPEMTQEEATVWLQKYMDEKFPKQA